VVVGRLVRPLEFELWFCQLSCFVVVVVVVVVVCGCRCCADFIFVSHSPGWLTWNLRFSIVSGVFGLPFDEFTSTASFFVSRPSIHTF